MFSKHNTGYGVMLVLLFDSRSNNTGSMPFLSEKSEGIAGCQPEGIVAYREEPDTYADRQE